MVTHLVRHRIPYAVVAAIVWGILGWSTGGSYYDLSMAEIEWQIIRAFICAGTMSFLMAFPFTLAQATLPDFKWKRESVDLMAIILLATLTLILTYAVMIGVGSGRMNYSYHHSISACVWRGIFQSARFLKDAGYLFMGFLGLNIFFSFLLFFCLPIWLRLFYSRLFDFCRVKRIDFSRG